ncbi:MAG: MgtC/SapB family protein [Verrucomicrobia bacterium]|jgi:putative Mg2+ transporter-C (MgtC) family protein|nr:MgtC/SapB family protein [Verrucomicrobiota bacterium]
MVSRYFTEDWHGFLSTPWLQIALALTSVVCGAIVGAEREKREKPAGLRTLILVCLGSTAFTMASFAFTSTTGDSGRVAAQIVTGIGFLGAGAILHGAGFVRGMTTAATIWASAATGMVVGIGYAGAGLGLSVLVRVVLSVALALEKRALGAARESRVELVFEVNGGKTRIQIEKIMDDYHVGWPLDAGEPAPNGTVRATFQCRLPRRHHREFLNELARLTQVKQMTELEK